MTLYIENPKKKKKKVFGEKKKKNKFKKKENPKNATRKLLELINEFGKVTGYKINTQKSLAFLYTTNKRSEREIKEPILFTIPSKRIKHPGINLPKEAKIYNLKTIRPW